MSSWGGGVVAGGVFTVDGGARSSEFFKIDLMLWCRQAPVAHSSCDAD
jgi:hypothetical protein